ncbi:transporter substrate-binding domain-containing protein [Aliiglaciecola sp. CAU 1673]|uniref:substrate-binding periplasmic protein n=1 Tax=Aliiglaciecola sp. CAU 1673 TaxID=3032595 RepID=UPI0023DAC0A5|nr:transporter substrate-binding domain-containing protein [Aliiglaciecola sp. CAU 1673]MDF2176744.1 transporter substrate-binding domain-containing protein [Aliiglaciecola sp. CAU 1673]
MICSGRLLGLFLCLATISVQAQQRVAAVLTHADKPFVYQDSKDGLTGYAVELTREIQQQAGSDVPIQMLPWEAVQERMQQEPNLLAFAVVRTPEREEQFHWITPITRNMHGLFTTQARSDRMDSLQQAGKLSSIGVQGEDFRERLLKQAGLSNVVSFDDWPQAVEALAKGEIEAIFYSAAGLDFHCHRMNLDCSQLSSIYVHEEVATYLVLSKGPDSESLAKQWQKAAQAYKASAAFQKLANAWLIHYQRQYHLPLHIADGTMNFWRLSEDFPATISH